MIRCCVNVFVLLGVTLACYAGADESVGNVRRRFVQDFVKGEEWLMKEPESMWCYEVVFFDFNDDGQEEALTCDELDSGSGAYTWTFACRTPRGNIVASGRVADGVDMMSQSGKIGFGCPANRLYKVTFAEVERLVGMDVGMYEDIPTVDGKKSQKYSVQTILLSMPQGMHLVATKMANGIDDIVCNPGFCRIEHAQTEVYAGFDMKRLPPDQRHFIPEKEDLPNGGLTAPGDFNVFVRHYRKGVKQRLGIKKPVTVYAVFLDADFDGDADCYMSSDAEAVGDGRYSWTLHLNEANEFRKTKERVWINRGTIHDIAMLEPQDVAPKNAFYRAVRTYGTPQILVMESDGKRLHTHAYTHLLSEEDRRNCPPQNRNLLKAGQQTFDAWEGAMTAKYGFAPPKDFRDQISWLFFHHLERLPCLEYPEEE